jgi:hypothetical protein
MGDDRTVVDCCDEDIEVVGQPQIVVTEIGHDLATRPSLAFVVRTALMSGIAWKVDPCHSWIVKRCDNFGGFVGAPITNDEQLEVRERLFEHAGDRVRKNRRPVVGRDDHTDAPFGWRGVVHQRKGTMPAASGAS